MKKNGFLEILLIDVNTQHKYIPINIFYRKIRTREAFQTEMTSFFMAIPAKLDFEIWPMANTMNQRGWA